MSAVDVAVVGAGPWGLATAWRAAREGARVAVIDDGARPAARVAAGMLGPWSEAAPGEEALHALLVRSLAAWEAFAAELASDSGGADTGLRPGDSLAVAVRPRDVAPVRRRLEILADWGRPAAWVPGSALREIEPGLGTSVAGGAELTGERQVQTRVFLPALRAAATARGARIVEGRAAALRPGGVELEGGARVEAGVTVVAAGWAASRLVAGAPLRPVKGQILRLRTAGGAQPPISRMVRSPGVYLAPRDDEVVVGATMEERGDTAVTAGAVAALLEEAILVVPELAELELAEAAAGLRPATSDGRPAIGRAADGSVWALGGYRHGILLCPLAADLAAAAALGRAMPDWAADLAPDRFLRGTP
ncbi:MAG: NAD(P)/FAD-dependent oxidoreductase [Thermoleophilia bacterium]